MNTRRKNKKQNAINAIKHNAPHVAFGIGAGAGGLAVLKSKNLKNPVLSALIPITAGSAAFLGSRKLMGEKLNREEKALLGTLAAGAGAVSVHDKVFQNKPFNPLRRNITGSIGGLTGAALAAALLN